MATKERVAIEGLLRVVNKDQQDVDFKLNTAQVKIDEEFQRRLVIPKARQEGVSTYFLARNTIKCLGIKNTRAVVISHDSESTERMLGKVKYFLDNMKGPKALLRNNSKNEITFPKTNSMFYIGTAGSRKFGRGDTITDLHCSEVAYWSDPRTLMSGLLQAVPKGTGCISIESTGNGAGDWYHSLCMRAAKGQSSFKMVFLPWWDFSEYTVRLTPEEEQYILSNLREDLEEPELLANYPITAGQLAWRRVVIEDEMEGDIFRWKMEYPACLDDCFQVAGAGVFQKVKYVETSDWERIDKNLCILKGHPHIDLHYIIGGDVSGGVGKDSSVAEVFCLETEEQVAEYSNDRIDPDIFAHKLADLGRRFNMAYLGVESNNHGILTMKELTTYSHEHAAQLYPSKLIYRTPAPRRRGAKDEVKRVVDLGIRTTARSKPYIIGNLRKKLSSGITIHSPVLKNELSTFVEYEDGNMGAADNCFDDTVMAAAMAFFVQTKAALVLLDHPVYNIVTTPPQNIFSLDSLIYELTKGRGDSPTHSFFPPHISGGL